MRASIFLSLGVLLLLLLLQPSTAMPSPVLDHRDILSPILDDINRALTNHNQSDSSRAILSALAHAQATPTTRPTSPAQVQAALDAQWALTFFPSTRALVQDFIAISPDFAGTALADANCLAMPCPPAVLQQETTAAFIRTLRAHGGTSALVPTTTVYSGLLDEVVQPQQGAGASAILTSASNNEVQAVCAGRGLGGGFYGHAGVLAHPVAYALVVDALGHEGPGRAERLDLDALCKWVAAEGLGLDDVLATAGLIPLAAARQLVFPDKRVAEPEVVAYAA